MIVTCPNCETKYNLPEDRIPAGGTKVKCSRCSHIFKAEPPASMPEEEVENLLDQEPETGAGTAAPDTDDEFDKAFNEVAGQGEAPADEPAGQESPAQEAAAETEEPAEHGGDVFADDDTPADDDFDSLFDEPVGNADEVSSEDFTPEADEQPAEEPEAAAAPSEPEDDLSDLFGDDEPEEADAPAPGGAQAPPEDDDYADLFGDDDDEPEAAPESSEAPSEGDDLEGGLFDEEPEEGDLFEQDEDETDEPAEKASEGPFETDFDLDEGGSEPQTGGKGKWVAMIVIFLIAAGIAAGWYFKAWKFFGIDPAALLSDVPVIGSMFDEGEAEAPLSPEEKIKNIELKNVRQYYVQNEKAGLVFVVQGEAVNAFDTPRERIEVEVFLYDANGNVLTSQRVMGGNTLSMFQLRVQSKQEIEEGLASEVGILSNNTFLRPGASTPFMAAIFEPPTDKVKEFGVKVVDVQKPE